MTMIPRFSRWFGASLALAAGSIAPRGTAAQVGARDPGPVMAIFAHPDDERVVAPLLHRLARSGREVRLVIATDGSRGVRPHSGFTAGKALADARTLEAGCAAKRIGARDVHMLGLEDGGLANFTALGKLRTAITALIAEARPEVLITFGREGGTGHPDHRLVGDVVTEIVQRDSLYRRVQLFYAQLPAERLKTAPKASPGVIGVAESLLTVRVPVEEQDVTAGREEFACHRTQYTAGEMEAINSYLAHAWNGVNWLRPWNDATVDRRAVFPEIP